MERIYKLITILAMLTMPIAASINFGDAAYDALLNTTSVNLAIVGGIATGAGFEFLGLIAGHRAVAFYSLNDSRWKLAAVVLLAYVVIGVAEMVEIPFARFVPLLSGLVYVLAGLQSTAEAEAEKQADRTAWELEQAAADKELERELKRQKLADETAVKLAKLEAGKKSADSTRRDVRQDSGELPTDWRQLTTEQKRELAHATRGERDDMFPEIAARTRRDWHNRLDKIAAQNGSYRG